MLNLLLDLSYTSIPRLTQVAISISQPVIRPGSSVVSLENIYIAESEDRLVLSRRE